jgi:uncharacterized protein involved in exopolysaccharide biosynthesis
MTFGLRHWRSIALYPVAAAILVGLGSFLLPREYTATTTFMPGATASGLGSLGGLASVARQFGVGANLSAPTAAFYAELASSRTVADSLLMSQFTDVGDLDVESDSVRLLDVFDIDSKSDVEELELARKRLREQTSIRTDNETGIVTLSYRSPSPELSAAVANRYLEYLNGFNSGTRQSSTRARRAFVEGQLANAQASMGEAEDELSAFLTLNRTYQQSPRLLVDYERLQRRVLLRQEILATLAREYEQAKIEEVNDTPVLTAVDVAIPPFDYSFPRPALLAVAALALMGVAGAMTALVKERVALQRLRNPGRAHELDDAFRSFRAEVSSLLRFRPYPK